jgi:hypothetical protein
MTTSFHPSTKRLIYVLAVFPLVYLSVLLFAQHKYIEGGMVDLERSEQHTLVEHHRTSDSLNTIISGYWLLNDLHRAMFNDQKTFTPDEIRHFASLAKKSTSSWREATFFNPNQLFEKDDFRARALSDFSARERILLRANEIGLAKWKQDLIEINTAIINGTSPAPATDCVLIQARASSFGHETQEQLNTHCHG